MPDFETKDSGEHEQYDSGMRRDTSAGKPRFDLIRTKRQPYDDQMITRYAKLLARGAAKYDARNWEDGDSEKELDRAQESLLRHVEQLIAGETDEDHAAAVWFNTQAIEYFKWRIEQKAKAAQVTRSIHIPNMHLEMEIRNASEDSIALITGRAVAPRFNVDPVDLVTEMYAEWHNRPVSEDIRKSEVDDAPSFD